MDPDLPATLQAVLRERGMPLRFVEQFCEDSTVLPRMQTFVFENDANSLSVHLSCNEKANAFAVLVTELATGKRQTFGFHASPGQSLKATLETALDSTPDLVPVLRGEKSPGNQFDWGDYK